MVPIVRSAIVVLETPDSFVLHRRPSKFGQPVYPGRLQFLDGHASLGEELVAAAKRKLGEATDLDAQNLVLQPLWEGEYIDPNISGEVLRRYHGLFLAPIPKVCGLREEGELVVVSKTEGAIDMYSQEMAPFASRVLGQLVTGGLVWL